MEIPHSVARKDGACPALSATKGKSRPEIIAIMASNACQGVAQKVHAQM